MPDYNGILLIDKPQGFTSFDVVAKLRGIARTKKVGHAGTLDPMATGVLPVFFGRATKACDILPTQDKRYLAQVRLGLTTDTLDITGTVLSQNEVHCLPDQVEAAALTFSGDIMQIPPMYSALKINGQKLCNLARQGMEVERKARPVKIHYITCKVLDATTHLYELDIHCSKGTYIRTLADDLGAKLGCGAVLSALCRTVAAGFPLSSCVTINQVQKAAESGHFDSLLLPVEKVFSDLPKAFLQGDQERMFLNGVRLDAKRVNCSSGGEQIAVYGDKGIFLGTAILRDGQLRMGKLFHLPMEQL